MQEAPVKHLSIEELAGRLGVPVRTIYYWNQTGYGPRRLRLGRTVRYRIEDVEAWEKTREATGAIGRWG